MSFRLLYGLSLVIAISGTVRAAAAQTQDISPIRVESNQVLVPAWVLNKNESSSHHWPLNSTKEVIKRVIEAAVVQGLRIEDFHLFEDGIEQKIETVSLEGSLYWDYRDNIGNHCEHFGLGDGKWSETQWAWSVSGEIYLPYYLIAYRPASSKEGSCHQIKVKVDRRNAVVYARNEYCNITHAANDPLRGTDIGRNLEALSNDGEGTIPVSLAALSFFTRTGQDRVYIALDFPPLSKPKDPAPVVTLGMLYGEDGSLAARFSDSTEGVEGVVRYETEIVLAPGEYTLRAMIAHGGEFGRSNSTLTIANSDKQQLSLSQIALCRWVQETDESLASSDTASAGRWAAKMGGIYEPLVSKGIEVKPTANTSFKQTERLISYFEVFEPKLLVPESGPIVKYEIRVTDVHTGECKIDTGLRSARSFMRETNPVILVAEEIAVKRLPAGTYRLEVQASDSLGNRTPWSTASFTIAQ